jgi:hypothetical protein
MTEKNRYETATPTSPDEEVLQYAVIFSADDDGFDLSASFVSPHPLTAESAANAMALSVPDVDFNGGSWTTVYSFLKEDSFAITTGGDGAIDEIFVVDRSSLLAALVKSVSDGAYEARITFKGEKRVKSEYWYEVPFDGDTRLKKPDSAPDGWSGLDEYGQAMDWEECEGKDLLLALGYTER